MREDAVGARRVSADRLLCQKQAVAIDGVTHAVYLVDARREMVGACVDRIPVFAEQRLARRVGNGGLNDVGAGPVIRCYVAV